MTQIPTIYAYNVTTIINTLHTQSKVLRKPRSSIIIVNPIRSGLFQTVNDPGALKASPPPYDLENYCVNLHHIIHVHFTRCFRHVPIGIFKKFAILTILYSNFKIKSSENSCKNNIFVILFKIDFKYIKSRRILMRI